MSICFGNLQIVLSCKVIQIEKKMVKMTGDTVHGSGQRRPIDRLVRYKVRERSGKIYTEKTVCQLILCLDFRDLIQETKRSENDIVL